MSPEITFYNIKITFFFSLTKNLSKGIESFCKWVTIVWMWNRKHLFYSTNLSLHTQIEDFSKFHMLYLPVEEKLKFYHWEVVTGAHMLSLFWLFFHLSFHHLLILKRYPVPSWKQCLYSFATYWKVIAFKWRYCKFFFAESHHLFFPQAEIIKLPSNKL